MLVLLLAVVVVAAVCGGSGGGGGWRPKHVLDTCVCWFVPVAVGRVERCRHGASTERVLPPPLDARRR
uniref:Secreted protein n=1 Tax=Angiostrongylus cantonensis TaxID=6313 RepID=A0A0K0DL11_ANGCA